MCLELIPIRIRTDPDPQNCKADILLTSSSVAQSRHRTSLSSRQAAGGISQSSCCGLECTPARTAQMRGINKKQSLEIRIRNDIWLPWILIAMKITKCHEKSCCAYVGLVNFKKPKSSSIKFFKWYIKLFVWRQTYPWFGFASIWRSLDPDPHCGKNLDPDPGKSIRIRNTDKQIFKNSRNKECVCSTTGKPTRSFATERVSLDSV